MTSERYFTIATLPLIRQKQELMKKPEMTFEFISRKNHERCAEFMRQAWLLGLHEDGYLFATLRNQWLCNDNWRNWPGVGKYDFVVARANGAIVGMIMHEASESTIDTYVIPSWRKRGVASQLVAALRENIGDSKVLCGWTGKKGEGWEHYYARNFILFLDQPVPKDLIAQHGDSERAKSAFFKSLKLKMAAAYRKHKAGK